jgi:hypothetical protein
MDQHDHFGGGDVAISDFRNSCFQEDGGKFRGRRLDENVLVQFDVRQASACRSSGDKLKFVGHLFRNDDIQMKPIIRCENLGKKYLLGARETVAPTLRETLKNSLKSKAESSAAATGTRWFGPEGCQL